MFCFSLKKLRCAYSRIVILLVFGLGCGPVIAQAQDDYLKSLEGEASDLELDQQTRATSEKGSSNGAGVPANAVGQNDSAVSDIIPGLSIEQFEQALEHHYIGSYLFYKKLSDTQKQTVYSAYQTNPDPTSIRDTILKVRKQ